MVVTGPLEESTVITIFAAKLLEASQDDEKFFS